MTKLKNVLLLSLIFSFPLLVILLHWDNPKIVLAQTTNPVLIYNTAPVGDCIVRRFVVTLDTGDIYYCRPDNLDWTQLSGGGGGGGGYATIQNNGTSLTQRTTLNVIPGTGVTTNCADNVTKTDCTFTADTNVMLSKATYQSSIPISCVSTSGSATTYTCALNPSLTAYQDNMIIIWENDIACTGSTPTTLNIDTLGAKRVYQINGTSDPSSSQCPANSKIIMVYDSALTAGAGGFRIVNSTSSTVTNPNRFTVRTCGQHFATTFTPTNVNSAACATSNGAFNPTQGIGARLGNGNTDYSWFDVLLPSTWTGTLTLSAFHSLEQVINGQGDVTMSYDTVCWTPGTTTITSAFTFNTATTVVDTFTPAQYQVGKYDTVTPAVTGCSAGQMMRIRARRTASTAGDHSILFYMVASLPYTM